MNPVEEVSKRLKRIEAILCCGDADNPNSGATITPMVYSTKEDPNTQLVGLQATQVDEFGNLVKMYFDKDGNSLKEENITVSQEGSVANHKIITGSTKSFSNLKSISVRVLSGTANITINGETVAYQQDTGFSVSDDLLLKNAVTINAANSSVLVVTLS